MSCYYSKQEWKIVQQTRDRNHLAMVAQRPENRDCGEYVSKLEAMPGWGQAPPYGSRELNNNDY
ncbi:hypothetical protein Ga0466249_005039 [Sporomusaceae bacterium BoRhaA]|uniref:hypothetical protein n=1 Tax=Pelorhabdus rhamnosifermentans TaxID=2772457 RepID=UPI001C064544|nr:hypothetical protein [Pelorhabdus rhamnosifermentans]MBU2703889.1 hypothetical protein [Pelorhabdus rhamnosifermentans]